MYEVGARVGAKSISCRPKAFGGRLGSFLLELKSCIDDVSSAFPECSPSPGATRIVTLLVTLTAQSS
jgi:hypothetical protein